MKTLHSNRRNFLQHAALASFGLPAFAPGSAASVQDKNSAAPIRAAVITGGHGFDVPNFHKLFRALLPKVEADIQYMDDFVTTPTAVRDQYDVVLFYIMLMPTPANGPAKDAIEHLGATEQGIFVLHHALLAYPAWPLWSELVGIADRKFGFFHDQNLKVQVANTQHPITRGLQSWEMIDETYTMADAGQGSEILLTLDHPKSMKTIGWTRQFKKSRVFCLESGHDNQTWVNPNFREVLQRGIEWCARRR